MTIVFVLNMSLLKKFISSRESQRLDSAMSTICHITILQCSTKTGLLFSIHDNRSGNFVPCNLGCLIERSFVGSQLPELARYSTAVCARSLARAPGIEPGSAWNGDGNLRVFVLFAHPVAASFGAGLHAKVVQTLRARGHAVDDCDLNAEGFDPVMTAEDRLGYYDIPG